MKPYFVFFLFSFFLTFIGCKKSTTPITTTQISLTAEYVGVIEAELRLQVDSSQPYNALQLLRDGQPVLSVPFSASDTTLLDTTLLPANTYTFQATLYCNTRPSAESDELTITTMDTTSHDFNWEIFTFESPFGSGALYDVAIINENNIWAVGEIYADSAQPWLPYNSVHWDGQQWELKRIPFTGWCSAVEFPPIRSVLAFSENDIWFARGGSLVHYNGNSFYNDCEMNPLLAGSINKIWGTDSNNLFIVGGMGTIVYYNGSAWQKLESGTDLPIQDIWGVKSSVADQNLILAPASKKYDVGEKKLLHVHDDTHEVTELLWPFQNRRIHSVWFKNPRQLWVCGAGIFLYKYSVWKEFTEVPLIFTNNIRGQDVNDIFVVGDFGIVAHYNGISWKTFLNFPASLYYSCDYNDNIMVAVGGLNPDAIILRAARR